jgi:hypothetical protein
LLGARHEQPRLHISFTVEDALSMQQALDEWNAAEHVNETEAAGASLAEHIQVIVDKLKGEL